MGLHIIKRDNCPLWKKCLFYVAAVLAALLAGGVILLSIGVDPIAYYTRMFTLGTIGNKIAYKTYMNYLKDFVPLVLTSVALSLAFKMRFWNIGGEGQFIMGAIAASAVALKLGESLPSWAVLALMCLAAMVAAGLYGLLVALADEALQGITPGRAPGLMDVVLDYCGYFCGFALVFSVADWLLRRKIRKQRK